MLNDFKNLQRHGDFMYAVNSGTQLTKIFIIEQNLFTYMYWMSWILFNHLIVKGPLILKKN